MEEKIIKKAKEMLANADTGTTDCKHYNNGFIDGIEYAIKALRQSPVNFSVTYKGVTYNWGDKIISPNGYEFFVVTDEGRWGLVDYEGTFCELQHCDLTGYLHYR